MFGELWDYISVVFSWRWPKAEGAITSVHTRTFRYCDRGGSDLRLVVTYAFSVGTDGPYTGETVSPALFGEIDEIDLDKTLRIGQAVIVRYRQDDPSLNRLDRSVWQSLDSL
jgi:hypothetical protein